MVLLDEIYNLKIYVVWSQYRKNQVYLLTSHKCKNISNDAWLSDREPSRIFKKRTDSYLNAVDLFFDSLACK